MTPRLRILLLALAAAGCGDEFATPSAYDAVPDWCADDDALQDALDACVEEREEDCGGVVSFRGEIDGREVAVSSALTSTIRVGSRLEDGGELFLNEVQSSGQGPYFRFLLKLETVGGAFEDDAPARDLLVSRGAAGADEPLDDDAVAVSLRLEAGGESDERPARTGTVEITRQTATDLDGTFEVELADDADAVAGCFRLRQTETRVAAL